ncbi:hypothetical protein [Dyella subtropica]|uniref:hypothetical protein n=1 Tax=Dyella subtropica TaxID=2992127 RepID=UPI0022589B98|nr:hypothetical protein [Dyella subtropica]
MTASLSMRASLTPKAANILLGTGLLVATVDAIFASTFWRLVAGVPASRIVQGIAAGLLGKAAFQGGAGTMGLGAVLHYGMAIAMVFAYYFASRWLPALVRRPWMYGPLYGLVVYAVMNGIVVPLSAAPPSPHLLGWVISSIFVHMFVVGLPSALAARAALGGAPEV